MSGEQAARALADRAREMWEAHGGSLSSAEVEHLVTEARAADVLRTLHVVARGRRASAILTGGGEVLAEAYGHLAAACVQAEVSQEKDSSAHTLGWDA